MSNLKKLNISNNGLLVEPLWQHLYDEIWRSGHSQIYGKLWRQLLTPLYRKLRDIGGIGRIGGK